MADDQRTTIRFASGMDGEFARPPQAKHAGFDKRFAVIQDTHVPGHDDMVFDEALWRALASFMTGLGMTIEVVDRAGKGSRPQSLDSWMAQLDASPADDRSPPDLLLAREGDALRVCMVTEFWCEVGGPLLYHDSYTYSFYSAQDLGRDVLAFLHARNAAGLWNLSEEVVIVSPGKPPGIVQRVLDWLR